MGTRHAGMEEKRERKGSQEERRGDGGVRGGRVYYQWGFVRMRGGFASVFMGSDGVL